MQKYENSLTFGTSFQIKKERNLTFSKVSSLFDISALHKLYRFVSAASFSHYFL